VADPTASAARYWTPQEHATKNRSLSLYFPSFAFPDAIEDLLLQDALLDATERAVATIVEAPAGFMTVLVVGAPLRQGPRT
jgi:NAD+ synthase (glutamine-hydrolysing)